MKRSFFLFAPVAILLLGGPTQPYAFGQDQHQEFVIVEFTVGREKLLHKFRVPVVANPKSSKRIDDRSAGGGWAFTGACPRDIGCEYVLFANADAVAEDRYRVTASLSFKNRRACDADKAFYVVRGKPTEVKARCRARIKAYYDDGTPVIN